MIARIRKGNDFKHIWPITWNGQPEDFSDATDITLTATVYGEVKTLTEGVDYHIDGGNVMVDFTPAICDITGTYTVELNYIKPSAEFVDGDRRSAVDVQAFQIVNTSAEANATEGVSLTSEALAIYALKYEDLSPENIAELQRPATEAAESIGELEQTIEGNEAIRQSNESDRQIAEGLRQTNTLTAIQNANTAADNANEMSSHPPVIINDYWHIWNFTTNQYETTGQYARGDSAVEGALVVQTTGQSAVNTMSQKAVTDEIAQLAGEVSVKMTNLLVNGDFSNGLTGWVAGANVTVSNGIVSIDTASSVAFRQVGLNIPANSVCYMAVRSQKIDGEGMVRMVLTDPDGTEVSDPYLISNSQGWLNQSVLLTTNSNADRLHSSRVLVGGILQLDFVILINLTESFGLGNEPTKEEFELLLATLGIDYFEGEITIPAQKVMQWQLKLANTAQDDLALKANQTELDQLSGSVGIDQFAANANILAELSGSDLSDTELWGEGYLNSTGGVNPSTWRHSKKYYRIAPGTCTAYLALSGNAKALVYNDRGEIVHVIGERTDQEGSVTYLSSETFPEDAYYIRLSHPSYVNTSNIRLRYSVPLNLPTNKVFALERDVIAGSANMLVKTLQNIKPLRRTPPIITFMSDDGSIRNDWFIDALSVYGYKATFAIITGQIDVNPNTFNRDGIIELLNNGHEIAGHCMSFDKILTSLTEDELHYEIGRCKFKLLELDNRIESTNFVSPMGSRNEIVDRVVRQYFSANYTTRADSVVGTPYSINRPPIDNYNMTRVSSDTSPSDSLHISNIDITKQSVDYVNANGGWLIFAIHPHYPQYDNSINTVDRRQELRDLLAYINSLDIPVMTAAQARRHYENISIGNYRLDDLNEYYEIGCDGSTRGQMFNY